MYNIRPLKKNKLVLPRDKEKSWKLEPWQFNGTIDNSLALDDNPAFEFN